MQDGYVCKTRSGGPEVDDSVAVIGGRDAPDVDGPDGVDVVGLGGSFAVDAFIGLDVLGEVGDVALLGLLRVGLLVHGEVGLEGVLACVGGRVPFLTNRATFLLKPPTSSSRLPLMKPDRKGRPFHCTSSSPATTAPSAMSQTLKWLLCGRTRRAVPPSWKLTWLIHPPRLSTVNRTSNIDSTFLKGPSYWQSSTLELVISGSFEPRKLLVTILTEKSADPMARMLELGWKARVVMGARVRLPLLVITQQFSSLLKQLMASVLQEDPMANFLALGAHRATRIDSLMSMLTSIFSHRPSPTCRQTTTERSWLAVTILRSAAQSMSLTVCVSSLNSWRSCQESTCVSSVTRQRWTTWSCLVATAQQAASGEKASAEMQLVCQRRELVCSAFMD